MKYHGIVEGFYWKIKDQINGQYKEFNHNKRIKLLEFMSFKGLNTYVYDPKLLRGRNYERAYSIELIGDSEKWGYTFDKAKSNNVNFYWGLAPGRYNRWKKNSLQPTIDHLLNLGVDGFTLLFDDVAGGARMDQMKYQAELATELYVKHNCNIIGFCPGKYKGEKEEVENYLSSLDQNMPPEISFILTGIKTWNRSIELKDLPIFENRGIIIWDNWMASDTSKPSRLVLSPPNRNKKLLKNISGYLLNPCFPVERIIPVVSAVGEMIHNENYNTDKSNLDYILNQMGEDWGVFLETDSSVLKNFLFKKVSKKKKSYSQSDFEEIIVKWPDLGPIFDL